MKNVKNVKRLFWGVVVLLFAALGAKKCSPSNEEECQDNTPEDVATYNVNRACELFDELFPLIAFCEDSKGEEAYHCGARWTLAYGVTVYPDGRRVKKGDCCSLIEAKEYCRYHVCNRVAPFLMYTTRKMEDREILGTLLFIYNVGGENFSGCSLDGRVVGNPSSVLQAINVGDDAQDVVNCMTGFRRSGRKLAKGLLKVRWVQGAVYMGILTSENVLALTPAKFYQTKNLGNYYELDAKRNLIEVDGFYRLRYDSITINTFFRMNAPKGREKTVAQIMP